MTGISKVTECVKDLDNKNLIKLGFLVLEDSILNIRHISSFNTLCEENVKTIRNL